MKRAGDKLAIMGTAGILAWLAAALLLAVEARIAVGISIVIAGFTGLAVSLADKRELLYRAGLSITVIFAGLVVAGANYRYVLAGWLLAIASLLAMNVLRSAGKTPRRP